MIIPRKRVCDCCGKDISRDWAYFIRYRRICEMGICAEFKDKRKLDFCHECFYYILKEAKKNVSDKGDI